MAPELSVIIPTLNEAAALPTLLAQLGRQQNLALEIIVADGGSSDDTVALAQRSGARTVVAPRGRGAQMNAGASAARGRYLLFVHADSELVTTGQLRDAVDALAARVALEGPRCAGHFALRFARRAADHALFYRHVEAKTALNRPGTINGDQGLLLPAEFFRELGGYDERLPFLEDQRIAAKIFERGRWQVLPGLLVTSARRFEAEGPYRRYTLMALIMGLHAAGAEEFFARAKQVYAAPDAAGPLPVGAYLALTWRVLIDAGGRGAARILWRSGRYARQNAWQVFFWCGVLLRTRGRRCLRFYDRIVQPLLNNPLADALATVLVSAWFLLALPLAYLVIDGLPPRGKVTGGPAG